MKRKPFTLGEVEVAAGEHRQIALPTMALPGQTEAMMNVHVFHGRREGPVLFVSAAVHGDEVNGVEIIRRLLNYYQLKKLRGTLLVVPLVNPYGFMNRSRYLPDRRDLNRCFPGSETGSLGARLADAFLRYVVAVSDVGIDLHTGSAHRTNLPQIRARLEDEYTSELATAFRAPVMINTAIQDGSLRAAVSEHNVPVLLYEAGEALRLDEAAIRIGLQGVLNVMRHLEMLPKQATKRSAERETIRAYRSRWMRAPCSGLFRSVRGLGDFVRKGQTLGYVYNPADNTDVAVASQLEGVIIGKSHMPAAYEGDAVFHVATVTDAEDVEEVGSVDSWLDNDRLGLMDTEYNDFLM